MLRTEPQGSEREAQGLRKQRVQTKGFLFGSRSTFDNGNTNEQRSVVSAYRATLMHRSNEMDLENHKFCERERR